MKPAAVKLEKLSLVAARGLALVLLGVTVNAWASVTVTLTAPANGTVYTYPSNVSLAANASAGQGFTVSKVEFFHGTTLIGTDFSSPYSVNWTGAPVGQHSLTAKATAIKKNNPDQTATSSVVNITMNARPTAEVTAPPADSTLPIATPTVTLSADASDSDGTIAKVEFHGCSGGASGLIATVTQAPYSYQWTPPPPYITATNKYQTYGVYAVATDNHGATGSDFHCHSFLMTPASDITSPTNGASYTAPATIPLEATLSPVASSSINFVTVQFYEGTNLIGQKTAPPFTFSWQNAPQGSYSIRAKMSLSGYEWWSDPINVTVNAYTAQLHYVHTDHLNTPRLVADATGTTVWRWDQAEPFANNPADEDPDANSIAFDLPLRLPGQYLDKETGLHYNYFRDYDPSLGRYGESDPIGLNGGLNTYAYVVGSPVNFSDPSGLVRWNGSYETWVIGAYTRDEYELESECKCGQIVTVRISVDSLGKGYGFSMGEGRMSFEDHFDCPNPMAFAGIALGATLQGGITEIDHGGGVKTPLGFSCSRLLLGVARSVGNQCQPTNMGGLSGGAGAGMARVHEDVTVRPCGGCKDP